MDRIRVRKNRHAHGYVITLGDKYPVFVEGPKNARVNGFPFAFIEANRRAHEGAW